MNARRLVASMLLLACGAAACGLHEWLRGERARLGLDPARSSAVLSVDAESGRQSGVAVVATALGVLRPLAINVLSLRAERLEREGRFHESTALALGVAALLPRLPAVWIHLASKLAWDISLEVPVGERFDWILEGVRLLRDEAPEWGQTSPRLYQALGLIFYDRLHASRDAAVGRGQTELARRFEPPEGVEDPAGWRTRRALEWKIDPGFLDMIGRRLYGEDSGERLDLRHPLVHSLYWSSLGLASRPSDEGFAWNLRMLRDLAVAGLAGTGTVVRSELTGEYARLPDPRLVPIVLASFAAEREIVPEAQRTDIDESRGVFVRWSIVHRATLGLMEDAARAFRSEPDISASAPSLESFLASALRGGEDLPAERIVEHAAALLRASLGLRAVDRPEATAVVGARRGLSTLAALLVADARARGIGLPDPAEIEAAVGAQWRRQIDQDPLTRPFSSLWNDIAPGDGGAGIELPASPRMPEILEELGAASLDPWSEGDT